MVHVGALPGTPGSSLPLTQINDQSRQEAEVYKDVGVDGLILENMHHVLYTVHPGPEVTAALVVVLCSVRWSCPCVPLGGQVLCAANQQALTIALAAGLDFIQVEGCVFSHVADEGIINACAGDLLRYRKHIGEDSIQIFADIKKKHRLEFVLAQPIDKSPSTNQAKGVFSREPVLVCSRNTTITNFSIHFFFPCLKTWQIIESLWRGFQRQELTLILVFSSEVKHAVKIAVLVGSGVTLENVRNYLDADALIIGLYFKKEGYWANAVDPDRVKKFMEHKSKLRE
ncbi:uncharacterized protein F13E9.13, mitochondrial-like [Lonchura striata]